MRTFTYTFLILIVVLVSLGGVSLAAKAAPVAQAEPTAQATLTVQAAPTEQGLPTGQAAPVTQTVTVTQAAPAAQAAPPAQASSGLQWSPPERLPGYDDEADAPFLIADKNRTVHAFGSVNTGSEVAIEYSQWTQVNGWTAPIDILLDSWAGNARIMGAFLDEAGYVHVLFFGGDDRNGAYFYARAPLSQAGRATAWSRLRLIGEHAITPSAAALTGDGKGNLYVVFSGNRDGVGVYSVFSRDSGETWTEPSVVYIVPDENHWPWALSLLYDSESYLHAVWTLSNVRGNGDALLYSRLDPQTSQWSNTSVLALKDAGDYEVDWGTLAEHDGTLILIYDDSQPATRWMRRSADHGKTWSNPVLPFNYVGEYRFPAMVTDSAGNLHMILGNRTRQTEATHGMWHSVWLGDRWSELEPVISGPRITSGPQPQRFDPSGPSAVIVNGNVLLVAWSTDPGAGRNGVRSSYAVLNTPALPPQPLPTLAPVPTDTPLPSILAFLTPSPTPNGTSAAVGTPVAPGSAAAPPSPLEDPSTVLIAAIIPAFLLIGAVVLVFRTRPYPRP